MFSMKQVAVAAAALCLSVGAAQAAVHDGGNYTVTYDDTTPLFSGIDFWSDSSFGFNIAPGLLAQGLVMGGSTSHYTVPNFTLQAKAGYVLSGPLTGFIGNLPYFVTGDGGIAGYVEGDIDIDGLTLLNQNVNLDVTPYGGGTGHLSATGSGPFGQFTSLSFTNGLLSLTAYGNGSSSLAFITSQGQSEMSLSFSVTAVPEPETYAMLLAGLGALGFMARRRQGK